MHVAFVCNPPRFAARLPFELRAAVVMPPFRRHIRHRPAEQVPYLSSIPTHPNFITHLRNIQNSERHFPVPASGSVIDNMHNILDAHPKSGSSDDPIPSLDFPCFRFMLM